MKDWFYQHKELGLCLTWKAFKDNGISEDTLSVASRRNSKVWAMVDHPELKRTKLIVWKDLNSKHKKIITDAIKSDIHEYIAKQPIRDLLRIDYAAEDFYRKKLLEMKVGKLAFYTDRYTIMASWLNLLIKAKDSKQFIREKLNLSSKEFTKHVCEIMESDKTGLPTNDRSLDRKIKQYKTEGYHCLIDWKFGNKNSAKIGKTENGFDADLAEEQIAFIRTASSKHNNFDAAQIARAVNEVFKLKGYPTVSDTTVFNIITANKHLTIAGSRGKRTYNNEIAMQVKRKSPDYPLQFWTLDGWTVELAFMDTDGKPKRLVVVIVLDVMNKYPVGFAIGERETADLIREANRNAINHVKELFEDYYRPWQIQSDNFAIKYNTPFFTAIAKLFTPAAIGNAKSKVIEPYFMYLNKKYAQQKFNWQGHNIDAKKSNQVNREYSDKIKNLFPDKAGVIQQINGIIAQERALKGQQYVAAWRQMPEDKKPAVLSEIDRLMVFGKPTNYTNSIVGQGLIVSIKGNQHTYDTFDPAFRALKHLSWKIIYDSFDLNKILVLSEDDKHRFILEKKKAIPMDIKSMKPDDHNLLTKIKHFNREREEEIMNTYVSDRNIVDRSLSSLQLEDDHELALKGMFTFNGQQKETLQDAKGLKKCKAQELKRVEKDQAQEAENWRLMQLKYMESKIDIKKYFD